MPHKTVLEQMPFAVLLLWWFEVISVTPHYSAIFIMNDSNVIISVTSPSFHTTFLLCRGSAVLQFVQMLMALDWFFVVVYSSIFNSFVKLEYVPSLCSGMHVIVFLPISWSIGDIRLFLEEYFWYWLVKWMGPQYFSVNWSTCSLNNTKDLDDHKI